MQVEEIILVLFKKRIHLANDLGGIPTNDAAWLIYRLSDNTSCRDNGIIRNGDTIKQDVPIKQLSPIVIGPQMSDFTFLSRNKPMLASCVRKQTSVEMVQFFPMVIR